MNLPEAFSFSEESSVPGDVNRSLSFAWKQQHIKLLLDGQGQSKDLSLEVPCSEKAQSADSAWQPVGLW